jgi:hypothetical protein
MGCYWWGPAPQKVLVEIGFVAWPLLEFDSLLIIPLIKILAPPRPSVTDDRPPRASTSPGSYQPYVSCASTIILAR